MADYITTYGGIHVDPTNPKPEDFQITDIAHALSLLCRGNGHVKSFYSVGQHCICCALEAEARGYDSRMILACLLHDASECYMSDVPRPFKKTMPEYQRQERELLAKLFKWFLGSPLTEEEEAVLKQIDDALLYYDLRELLNETSEGEAPQLHIQLDYQVQPFEEVEETYLRIYYLHQANVLRDLLRKNLKITSNHNIRYQSRFIVKCYQQAELLGHPEAVRNKEEFSRIFERFL